MGELLKEITGGKPGGSQKKTTGGKMNGAMPILPNGITKRESHQAQQASHDGEFSRELPKDKGGRPDNNSTHDGESYQTKLYILKDAGITHQ